MARRDFITMRLEGGAELQRVLRTLPRNVQTKVVNRALRAGAKVIQAQAIMLAPKDTGQLRRSIKVRSGKTKHRGEKKIIVITGKGFYKGDQFYGAFQEFGWRPGKRSASDLMLQRAQKNLKTSIAAAKRASSGRVRTRRLSFLNKVDRGEIKDSRSKRIPGKEYMQRAYDNKKGEASRLVREELRKGTLQEAKSLSGPVAMKGGRP